VEYEAVDSDRGQGNNRCGGAAGAGPGKGKSLVPPDQIVVLGATETDLVAAAQATAPADIEQRHARDLAERADDGGVLAAQAQFLPVNTPLPRTGEGLLVLFLTGGLLALAGLALRRRVGSLA
jgi:hypothetical protein